MQTLIKTVDLVLLSFAQSLLEEAGIATFVLDGHASAVEGSIGVFIPRRLVAADDDALAARRILKEAGLGDELERA